MVDTLLSFFSTVYALRAGLKHLLYPVIQPQLTSYSIEIHGSVFVAMDLVAKRCKQLRVLKMTNSINLPPHHFINFFRYRSCKCVIVHE